MKTTSLQNTAPKLEDKKLDLPTAKEIKDLVDTNKGECSVLDLSSFSDADLFAIKYLSRYPYDFVILGIKRLNPEIAHLLGRWKGEPYLLFEELNTLDRESAKTLCSSSINLDFKVLNDLPLDVAKELAKGCGHLHLSLDTISTQMAQILSKQRFSLSLTLQNEPSYEVALELGQHQGYELFFYRITKKPSEEFIEALALNQSKAVFVDQQAFPYYSIESRTKDLAITN